MIRHDMLSKMLIVLAMMLSVYLATFETTTLVIFPGFLLMAGLVMEFFLEKKEEYVNHIQQPKTWKTILWYTLMALAGVLMIGRFLDYTSFIVLSIVSAISFSVLMAVAEEQFFRGFINDFLVSRFPNSINFGFLSLPGWFMGILCSAGIFTMYHLARYGSSPEAMMYVFAGGFILSFVSWKSRRISPCMLAHAINNAIAVIGIMGVIQ